MGKPIFISYKRVDTDRVIQIKEYIENQTGVECWIDVNGIESDAYFDDVICDAINNCEIFLFFYSKSHLKNTEGNNWPADELRFANDRNKHIVLIFLDDTKLTDKLDLRYGSKQRVFANKENDMQKLIRDINKWLGKLETETNLMASPNNDAVKESKKKEKVLVNFWNKAQKTVEKTQEAYKKIVPDFVEWSFAKDKELPKSLAIDTKDGKLCFVLSEDENFYLANVASKSDNFAWWNNKTIVIVGAGVLLAGAPVLAVVGVGLAGLSKMLMPKFSAKLFNTPKRSSNLTNVKVNREFCEKLSAATGYVIDLPTAVELKDVTEEAQDSCIVIRISDNRKLFQKRD